MNSIKKPFICFVFVLVAASLGACGGGSTSTNSSNNGGNPESTSPGDSNENDFAETDHGGSADEDFDELISDASLYDPDASLLETEAESSDTLYVAQNFRFETQRTLNLDLLVKDENGNPMRNKLVRVKTLDSNVSSWDDPLISEAQLLYISRTDSSGKINQSIEITDQLQKLLIEINTIGIENRAIVSIANENPASLSYTFH